MYKYVENTWLQYPAIIVFLISCWYITTSVMTLFKHFMGSWGMVLLMPIYWTYIINPLLDEFTEWFTEDNT